MKVNEVCSENATIIVPHYIFDAHIPNKLDVLIPKISSICHILIFQNVVTHINISILLVQFYTNFYFHLKSLLQLINRAEMQFISIMLFIKLNIFHYSDVQWLFGR